MDAMNVGGAADKATRDLQAITAWVEANLGGKVTSISQLFRLRETWRVDYEVDGVRRIVLAKGRRPFEGYPFPLEYEMKVNQILARNGIRAPAVFGIMDDPHVFFMEWVESDERAPGLMRQSTGGTSPLDPDRWAASLDYIEELARMHAIPIDQFAEAGMEFPGNPTELATGLFRARYAVLERLRLVDARMTFFKRWLERNAPQHRTAGTFVTGDSCQFLSRGPQVVAVLDFEISFIGDPLYDLACFRGRHPVENLGDIYALFRHYAEVTGKPLDLPVIGYQTVHFLALSMVGVMIGMSRPHVGADPMEEMGQVAFIFRRAMEGMAECAGVDLPQVSAPKRFRFPYGENAIENLIAGINQIPTSATFSDWQRGTLASAPRFLAHCLTLAPWIVEQYLADIAELTGTQHEDIVAADSALKTFVEQAGPEKDAALIHLFYRAAMRECWLAAGPDAGEDHLMFIKLEPILTG